MILFCIRVGLVRRRLRGKRSVYSRRATRCCGAVTALEKRCCWDSCRPMCGKVYLADPDAFALPVRLNPSLGINVNFTHAGFSALGKRRLRHGEASDLELWPILFGDLLNYYLVDKLIGALRFLQGGGRGVAEDMGARLEPERVDEWSPTPGARRLLVRRPRRRGWCRRTEPPSTQSD